LKEHISGSVELETCVEVLAGISRREAPKVKKEEARQEKIEGATHNEGGPIQGIKIRKLKELQGRSLANAKSLKEFVRHGYPWVPTDQAHDRPRQVGPAYQETRRPVSGPNRPS
jgi:hypothetical protein